MFSSFKNIEAIFDEFVPQVARKGFLKFLSLKNL